jgi:hypothetical protein
VPVSTETSFVLKVLNPCIDNDYVSLVAPFVPARLDDYQMATGLDGTVIYTFPQFSILYKTQVTQEPVEVVESKSWTELAIEEFDQTGFVAETQTTKYTGNWPYNNHN